MATRPAFSIFVGKSLLVNKAKVQPPVAVLLPCLGVVLVRGTLGLGHGSPLALLALVERLQHRPLHQQRDEAEGADGDEHGVAALVVRGVVGSVNLRPRDGAHLHHDVVRRRRHGPLLDVKRVLRDPGRDDGVEVRVARDERHEREALPRPAAVRDRQHGGQQGQDPRLAKEAVEGALVEVVAAVCQGQHRDDLERSGWDREHVGVKGRVAELAELICKVRLHRSGGNVGDEAHKVESPDRGVLPGVEDVLPLDRLLQCCSALCGIVAENAVDHYDLLALRVP